MNKLKAPLTEQIWVRVSPETKEKIQAAADSENRPMSSWINHVICLSLHADAQLENK